MENTFRILVINPGSTSTKIAVFLNSDCLMETTIRHPAEELSCFNAIPDQLLFRKTLIKETLDSKDISLSSIDAIVGRGGLLKPMESGTYFINEKMLDDLKKGVQGQHASNLAGIIARNIGDEIHKPSYIVDPVVVDEMEDIARITGLPEIQRTSIFHALNQKSVAKSVAKELSRKYEDLNLIVAHLGGGISIGAHKKGKVVDVNNALDGDGPFSPERAGSLPSEKLLKMFFHGRYSMDDVKKKLVGKGGLVAHLGTNDAKEVNKMIDSKNKHAELIYKAMAYQIAKEIGSYAAVLKGSVDAIILTGGIAYDSRFIDWISAHVAFISKIIVFPGENEMTALAEGVLRVLDGSEEGKEYA